MKKPKTPDQLPIDRSHDADKRVGDGGEMTQAEKFEAATRELGCDPSEDRFKGVLRKLAKPKS